MFKSVKTKILLTVMILFLIGIATITIISSTQVKNTTEKSATESSTALISEISFSIENFLGQYSKGTEQLSMTPTVTNFRLPNEVNPIPALENEFSNFLSFYEDASSIYFALSTKEFVNKPKANLGADFDPTTRE